MHIPRSSLISLCALLISAAAAPFALAKSITYQVNVNTSSVQGTDGYVDLQFNPAAQSGQQEATATVSNYTGATNPNPASPNTSTSGNVTVTGGAPLTPASVIVFDTGTGGSSASNYYLTDQAFTKSITFDLSLSGPEVQNPNGNGGGTTFYLSYFDTNGNPNLTSDADGIVAAVTISPNGTTTTQTFPGPSGGSPVVTFGPLATVPEPSSAFLLVSGGIGLLVFARRRAR